MEIRHAVLERKQADRRSYFYLRVTRTPREGTPRHVYEEFVQEDAAPRLDPLKEAIRRSGRITVSCPPVRRIVSSDYRSEESRVSFSSLRVQARQRGIAEQ